MHSSPGAAHPPTPHTGRVDLAARALAALETAWAEIGALPVAGVPEHLFDGPYAQVLTLAEERTRDAAVHVPLSELLNALRILRGRHLAESAAPVG